MEGYAEQGARTDSTDQIGFGGARRNRKKRRGLTLFNDTATTAIYTE